MKSRFRIPAVTFLLAAISTASFHAGAEPKCDPSALQSERFEVPLAKLRDYFKSDVAPEIALENMMKADARGAFFKVEGLLRLYKEKYPEFEYLLIEVVKPFEDALGHYDERVEYRKAAEKYKAPQKVIDNLAAQEAEAKKEFLAFYAKNTHVIDKLDSEIAKVDWRKTKKDRKDIIKALQSEFEDVAQLKYKMSDLQGGVHEMRRHLRWLLIYIQALNGQILLKDPVGALKLPEYSSLLTHPIAEGPFSKVAPNPDVKEPIYVSRELFLALSRVVQDLGAIKSEAEAIEAMALAFRETGAARTKETAHEKASALVRAELATKGKELVPFEESAGAIKKELKRTKLLKVMAKGIK